MSDVARAKKAKKDVYSNIALGSVIMSAANTLTFSQLNMAVGMFQGVALLIHRVSYMPNRATLRELVAATDSLAVALVTSNRLTTLLDASDPAMIDAHWWTGIAANVELMHTPVVHDFTGLPGGGKLVPANPLFVGAESGGFAAAGTIRVKLDFTFLELNDVDYLELLQSLYPITV